MKKISIIGMVFVLLSAPCAFSQEEEVEALKEIFTRIVERIMQTKVVQEDITLLKSQVQKNQERLNEALLKLQDISSQTEELLLWKENVLQKVPFEENFESINQRINALEKRLEAFEEIRDLLKAFSAGVQFSKMEELSKDISSLRQRTEKEKRIANIWRWSLAGAAALAFIVAIAGN
jgi:chromosome segregation ATPase